MIDQEIRFRPIDLNRCLDLVDSERFDLALSLEVAEHLEVSSAKNFVKTLTNLSDIVMFSAAFNGQGGMNHINEQPHTYWASLFRENGYAPHDVFRPVFWGDEEVDYWYQQNTFLYVKNSCWLVQVLADIGYVQVQNVRFMNCVHPALYKEKIAQASPAAVFRRMAVSVIPRPLLPPLRWFKKSLLA